MIFWLASAGQLQRGSLAGPGKRGENMMEKSMIEGRKERQSTEGLELLALHRITQLIGTAVNLETTLCQYPAGSCTIP